MADKEHRIRTRAYEIWEKGGQVNGDHDSHWEQASREIEAEGEEAEQTLDANLSLLGDKDAGIALQSDDAGVGDGTDLGVAKSKRASKPKKP